MRTQWPNVLRIGVRRVRPIRCELGKTPARTQSGVELARVGRPFGIRIEADSRTELRVGKRQHDFEKKKTGGQGEEAGILRDRATLGVGGGDDFLGKAARRTDDSFNPEAKVFSRDLPCLIRYNPIRRFVIKT